MERDARNDSGTPERSAVINLGSNEWKTKPTDRFILKWIKCHLSARLTPLLIRFSWLRPWMITVAAAALGVSAGIIFGMGWGFLAGLAALIAQVLDGVDGQFARLTGKDSSSGAFLDSVLDRYSDGAMLIGLTVYVWKLPLEVPSWLVLATGFLAIVGSGLISYTTARAETLGLDLGKPTLASKGTRMTLMALSGIGSPFWAPLPLVALCYLAIHANLVVVNRLMAAHGTEQ